MTIMPSLLTLCDRNRPTPILPLWFLVTFLLLTSAASFASRSRGRKASSNADRLGGDGFGKSPAKAYIPDTSNKIQELISFLGDEECEGIGPAQGTEIGFHPTTLVRGLYACKTFEAGDFLLGIPFPACLTLAVDDVTERETSDAELGLRLLQRILTTEHQQQQQPDYGAYLHCLPTRDQQFDASPDFWSEDEINSLEFPPLIERAKQRKLETLRMATTHQVNPDQLQFATWLVKSRGFTLLKPVRFEALPETTGAGLPYPDGGTIMSKTVMIPYLDMINHSSEKANTELQVLETKAEEESMYALQALCHIPKGSEITLCYGSGQESSVEMFSNYGFCTVNNPNDITLMNSWKDYVWSTSIEQDEAELKLIMNDRKGVDKVRIKVLDFRLQMKLSQAELEG